MYKKYICAYVFVFLFSCMHTHAYIYIYIHMYIHIHTHIYVYIHICMAVAASWGSFVGVGVLMEAARSILGSLIFANSYLYTEMKNDITLRSLRGI